MKTKKKDLPQKWNIFFTPNLSGDLRSDAHQSQIIGGEADVDHTQIIGGDAVKIFGGYIPPSPPPPPRPRISETLLKAKDQEYRNKCSSKTKQKKVLQKFFFRQSPKKQKKVRANFLQSF